MGKRAGEGDLEITGVICPYLKAAIHCGTRVCLVCGCTGQVDMCASIEEEALELYLACNCRRRAGLSMCHTRFVWDTVMLRFPARKEAPVGPPFPAVPGRVCPRPRQRSAVVGAPPSSDGE